MRWIAILPFLCASCAVQYGETRYPSGVTKSRYLHMDLGRDADAISGGAESYAVVGQDEGRSFRNAANLAGFVALINAQKAVELGQQGVDKTAIKEGAKTDRAGIGAEKATDLKALDVEKAKLLVE